MKKTLIDVIYVMIAAVLVFFLWCVSMPVPAMAQEQASPPIFMVGPHALPQPNTVECYPMLGYCVARIEDTNEARACLRNAPRMILGLQEQVKKLSELKGCAKTEVTEPSKAPKIEIQVAPGGAGL